MPNNISEEDFQDSIEYYSNVLRAAYLEEIEGATDQKYAKQHFQKLLFLGNEMVPYGSIVFNELRFSYNHFCRLNAKTSYKKTIELIPEIRKIGKTAYLDAKKHLLGNKTSSLDEWYIEQIEDSDYTLEELIQLESLVLESSDENLIGALAVHLAGRRLYKEYKNVITEKQEPKKKYQHQFTRNEQILAFYFLMKSVGVNPHQMCDRTKMAALFHLVMGVPYESSAKLKDLTIYKALAVVPQVVNDDKQFLRYLNKIRPYFYNTNFIEAVELIDSHISGLNTEID